MLTLVLFIMGTITGAAFGPVPWHNFDLAICNLFFGSRCVNPDSAWIVDGVMTGIMVALGGLYLDFQMFELIRKKDTTRIEWNDWSGNLPGKGQSDSKDQ